MLQVNIYEAKTQLSRLIEKSRNGEVVIIAKGNKPVVRLVPMEKQKPRRILGSARGMVKMSKDFPDPLEDFREYM
jgi:prevent-host-death family protein